MAASNIEDQLVKYLTDVHSIEEQALSQLERAPRIAKAAPLVAAFERHVGETEAQRERIEGLLTARGAKPSMLKDLAGKVGGLGMVAFAKLNPDTPGKLTAHAYSYEHLEVAAYQLLRLVAEQANDGEVAQAAGGIEAEEREMASRLADSFDAAVDASLEEVEPDSLSDQLDKYLADAHAIEVQALQLLESGPKLVESESLAATFTEHLDETREHERRVRERIEARGSSPSRFQDAGMRIGALNLGGFFAANPDTTAKLAGFSFAFEHLEIAAYELLARVARRAGDDETVQLAESLGTEERAAARQIESRFADAVTVSLATELEVEPEAMTGR